MVSHGEVLPIGASLNGLFNDPRIAENYGNLVRADAFVIARTLRVFGTSTDDIFATFRDSTTSYGAGELLIGKVITALEAHGVTTPSLLVVPFLDDPINQERDNDARDLIEVMNQVHFEWAIHEKGAIRQNFAEAILKAKS
jgi:EAL domain-containing protein (putative c-di-GMP-specific phosphodiesterase class I)